MKKLLFLIIICITVFAGSPYYAAYQMKVAFEANDGKALANTIDYPQLTGNISSQLHNRFSHTLSQYPLIEKLGGNTLAKMGNEFISSSVRGAITPENIENLVHTQNEISLATKKLGAAWAIASNKINLGNLVQSVLVNRGDLETTIKNEVETVMIQQQTEQAEKSKEDSQTPKLSYCGINCFEISSEVKGYPITVEMQRNGLIGWKIVNIDLP